MESSVSADSVTQSVSVGDVQVVQQATPANRPASLLATYKDLKLKVNADPEGKRHGAEFGNKNFDLSVARDFDDRINIIKRKAAVVLLIVNHWSFFCIRASWTDFNEARNRPVG